MMKKRILGVLLVDCFGRWHRICPVRRNRLRPNQLRERRASLQPTRPAACPASPDLRTNSEPVQPRLRMARNLQNMPARYRAQFSQWRNVVAPEHLRKHRKLGQRHEHRILPATVNTGYQQSTIPLLQYNGQVLVGDDARGAEPRQIQYASVELADGANVTAMATIGAIRDNAQTIQNQINNLEQDSLSDDPNLNTEVSVLNKINAANVLTLRTAPRLQQTPAVPSGTERYRRQAAARSHRQLHQLPTSVAVQIWQGILPR